MNRCMLIDFAWIFYSNISLTAFLQQTFAKEHSTCWRQQVTTIFCRTFERASFSLIQFELWPWLWLEKRRSIHKFQRILRTIKDKTELQKRKSYFASAFCVCDSFFYSKILMFSTITPEFFFPTSITTLNSKEKSKGPFSLLCTLSVDNELVRAHRSVFIFVFNNE